MEKNIQIKKHIKQTMELFIVKVKGTILKLMQCKKNFHMCNKITMNYKAQQ